MNTAMFLALALPLAAPRLKDRPGPGPLLGRWAADVMFIAGQSSRQWLGLEYEFAAGGRSSTGTGGRTPAGPGPTPRTPRPSPRPST